MLEINKHRSILIQILKDIYTDPSIGPLLGFKGGTASYFFYNLPRFSVDLDFDLLDLQKIGFIYKRIKEIISKYGKVQKSYNKRYTIFLLLSHTTDHQNIKIEISKRNFGSEYEILNYLGISMLIMKKQDLFAHKLVALLERTGIANRDLFDIWFFLKENWDINEKIVQKRTGADLKSHISNCLDFVGKVNNRNILSGIGELLNPKMKAWVKNKLKDELMFQLKLRYELDK
ncbi:nucleotidyl transferase AbiEii/AbiGii toxin family protein [Candidatus Margulisiibacteriota bacterium]